MNEKNTHNKPAVIDLNDLFRKIVFHWPLYLMVLLMAVGGAFIYLKYKKPVYMSAAKLYLKDEKKTGGEEADILKSLSLFNSGKNIENEMEVLKSPILLETTISKNHFNIRYYAKGTVRNEELYHNTPLIIRVLSDSAKVGYYKFDVTPDNGQLKIKASMPDHDSSVQLKVLPGEPFTVLKDRFAISYGPAATAANLTGTYRIRVDSVIELAYDIAEDISTALVNRDATIVLVTYKDPVPERTADFLNALLDNYNDYTLDDKNRVSYKTINFLNGRIDSLKEELGLLEKQEEQFKVQRGITDIDEGAKLALEQVKEADLKLNEANLQLSVFDQVENYVSNPSGDYPFAPVGNVDQTLTALISRYEEMLKEHKRLSLTLQPSSVILQNVDAQISDARKTIREYIAGYRRTAGVVQQQTQSKVNQLQGRIASIPAYAREYINIKRQQSVKENLYLHLLKKKEEAAVASASNVTDNKTISPAYVPDKPVAPRKPLVFIGFIAAALVLASAYIYIKYFLNPRVLSKKEIEQVFNMPVVAEIFRHEEGVRNLSLGNRSILREQILNLRTNIKFLLTEHTGTATILLTSSISGEGKTFLSAHLASTLTVNNKSVVLVELDLRKPKLSKFLGMDHNTGITNYILGTETEDEIIRSVPGVPRLFIVSSGPIPPNPIELMEGQRMSNLLSSLKEKFDYVIIDTSPIGIVSDAKSILAHIDCSLFVVRYNYTLKSKLVAVEEGLPEEFFRKTGIVFNGIEQDTFYPYYYYYQYRYEETKRERNTWGSFIKKTAKRIA